MLDCTRIVSIGKRCAARLALVALFVSSASAQAQPNCTSLTATNPEDTFQQIKTFLSDNRLAIAGSAVALVGTMGKSVKIQAIGGVATLASAVAAYLNLGCNELPSTPTDKVVPLA